MATNLSPVMRHDFADGKYTVIFESDGSLRALRHGEPWQDFSGNKLIYCMLQAFDDLKQSVVQPIPMILYCPNCGKQHIDASNEDEIRIRASELGITHGSREWDVFIEKHEWTNPPHRSHLCADCGTIWRPADVPTTGVAAITTKGTADDWIVESQTTRAAPVQVTKKL